MTLKKLVRIKERVLERILERVLYRGQHGRERRVFMEFFSALNKAHYYDRKAKETLAQLLYGDNSLRRNNRLEKKLHKYRLKCKKAAILVEAITIVTSYSDGYKNLGDYL